MTIVNFTHQFIYVHVPKTGGTGMKVHLHPYAGDDDIHIREHEDALHYHDKKNVNLNKHSTFREIVDIFGEAKLRPFFKFSVVRNPYARVISTFRFLKYKYREWPKASVMDEFGSLEDFVTSKFFQGPGPGAIFRPQMWWLSDSQKRLGVDFVGRTETLNADLAIVHARLGFPPPLESLEKVNASGGELSKLLPELTRREVLRVIRKRYDADFTMLGYSTDPAALLRRNEEELLDV